MHTFKQPGKEIVGIQLRPTCGFVDTFMVYFISFGFPSEFTIERASLKIWATEFPPVPYSSVSVRSVTVQKAVSGYELLLEHLVNDYTGKLYIEIHAASEDELVNFLNLTQNYQKRVQWIPCIVFHWPKKLTSYVGAEEIVSNIVTEMTHVQFQLNSEVYMAFDVEDKTSSAASTKQYLCDLYNHKRSKASYIKICKPFLQRSLLESESFFSYTPVSVKRRNLKTTKLNVIAQYDPDYKERIRVLVRDDGTVEFVNGMCLDILLAMQISMNFSFVPMKGNGWVGVLPNGSWTGMAAQLINEEGDLSIAQASMLLMINQLNGISFLHPSSTGQFVALFRQPKASSYKNLLTSVLTTQCWKFYFITWGIIVGTVVCIWFLQRQFSKPTEMDLAFVKGAVMWAVTTACVIGWYLRPSSMSYRGICIFASYLAYCTFVAFQAGLTVNLVTEVRPIRSFEELALSNLQVFTDKWLPVSRSLVEKIYSQRGVQIPLENSNLYTVDDGIHKIIHDDPPVAFVTFTDAVTTVFHRLLYSDPFFCEKVSSVLIASERTPAGMFVKRKSSLKEVLNYKYDQFDVESFLYCHHAVFH
ncbi:unnamed protein product [Orchesella dallaii]|uniref:Ionotropic glutamate receptor L-glutamate and glycine-binding domain-containing protein n=1 Tax=Orchesella dallaii TaxID=48710 RepID=A0ABP1QEK1_9HEXA